MRKAAGQADFDAWWQQVPIIVVSSFRSKTHFQHSMLGDYTVHGYFDKAEVFDDPTALLFTIVSLSRMFDHLLQREKTLDHYKVMKELTELSLLTKGVLEQIELMSEQSQRIEETLTRLVIMRFQKSNAEVKQRLLETLRDEIVKEIGDEECAKLLEEADSDLMTQLKRAFQTGDFETLIEFLVEVLDAAGLKQLLPGSVLVLKAVGAVLKVMK